MTDLQFDQADYGPNTEGGTGQDGTRQGETSHAVSCGLCDRSISDSYYKVNQAILCENCHGQVLTARGQSGGGAGRAFRALTFGLIAGAVGCGIYYGVLKLTGYEVGLISILVGFMVGFAVRFGANYRGGWFYQLLAVVITYGSIAASYVPMALDSIFADLETTNVEKQVTEDPAPAVEDPTPTVEDPAPTVEDFNRDSLSSGQWIVFVIVAFILALASPIVAGFGNILGILIIGFGLYQAWQLNKRVPFDSEGPFQVGATAV